MKTSVDVVIIGAGPYGLALAAYLRARRVEVRIFGDPMGSWKNNMPEGMLLKSYPWASNISDIESRFTVKQFCTDRRIPYHDTLMALSRETFIAYGEAFRARFVPSVERRLLFSLEPTDTGFVCRFDDGETVHSRRVVLAVGLSGFQYVPPGTSRLPPEMVSHSGDYGPTDRLTGKRVVVVGSGSSATDLAALLHEKGIPVSLLARAEELAFGAIRSRSLPARMIAPASGIGEGWTMALCARAPWVINRLPEEIRVRLAHTKALGPLGGAFMRDRVIGKVPLLLGHTLSDITVRNGVLQLHMIARRGGHSNTVDADHVIFATGYKVDVNRLPFLNGEIKARMRLVGTAPHLSRHYESSIPGLHFIGPASANSFGPVCRFVFGTPHPSRHLARYLKGGLHETRWIDSDQATSGVSGGYRRRA